MRTIKWQLQEAENQLSEVVRKAQSEGPQVITQHGTDAAVVVSAKDYGRLSRPKGKLMDLFRPTPLVEVELNLPRHKTSHD
jgi:antitoxin Phd